MSSAAQDAAMTHDHDLAPLCVLTKDGVDVLALTLHDVHGSGRRNSCWRNEEPPHQVFWNLKEVRAYAKERGLRVTRRPAV